MAISLVSVTPNGVAGNGASFSVGSGQHGLSADGRYVAFHSNASNLVAGDTNGTTADICVRDTATGTTTLLTLGGNPNSVVPSISADGRYVAFYSYASNFGPADNPQCQGWQAGRGCFLPRRSRSDVENLA